MYQKEIDIITKWWKKSNLMKKVSYARDRLVESYIWSLVFSHKPEYNKGRMFEEKLMACATILDDTYDAYSTIQELELFPEAIQRWDINLIGTFPQCMKVIFKLIKGYMVEAKWRQEGFIPTYEYKQQRAHVASAIECCMKQYCVSQAEAWNPILKDVEDYLKVINKEYSMSIDIPKSVLDCVVNYARMSEVTYENHQDKFTNGELLKDYVSSFLMNLMFIDQH
ncbi:Beta-caryophyllene synthase, partial [Mucuna pruriens]